MAFTKLHEKVLIMADKKQKKKRLKKKKKPSFVPLNYGHNKKVKARWRRPMGTANKQRRKKAWTPARPNIGYRNPESVRGLRNDGTEEVLVRSLKDLNALKDRKNIVIRIGGTVGMKKRITINDQAKTFGFRVLNFKEAPKKEEPKKEAPEKR